MQKLRLACVLAAALIGSSLSAAEAISATVARATAKQVLGGQISSAAELTTVNGSFILAAHRPYEGGTVDMQVLQKVGRSYVRTLTLKDLNLDYVTTGPEVRLVDLRHDGHLQAYWTYGSYGNSVGSEYFVLQDLTTRTSFISTISVQYGDKSQNQIVFDPKLLDPSRKLYLNFINAQIEASDAYPDPKAVNPAQRNIDLWFSLYGAISHGEAGYKLLKPVNLPLSACQNPEGSLVTKKVYLGTTYLSVFKSGVYAMNLQKKQCFLVYFPKDTYRWIGSITVVKGWIGLANRNDPQDVVYFQPQSNTLSRVHP